MKFHDTAKPFKYLSITNNRYLRYIGEIVTCSVKRQVNQRVISDTMNISDTISDDPNLSDLHTSFVSLNQPSTRQHSTDTDRGSKKSRRQDT
jgi:hypothetical protein